MLVGLLGGEVPLKEEMATHSSSLARKIPWTEDPGGLQTVGSQKSQTRLSTDTRACPQTHRHTDTHREVRLLTLHGAAKKKKKRNKGRIKYREKGK